MKVVLSILLLTYTACTSFAAEPIFEETTDLFAQTHVCSDDPIFEECEEIPTGDDIKGCDECDDPDHNHFLSVSELSTIDCVFTFQDADDLENPFEFQETDEAPPVTLFSRTLSTFEEENEPLAPYASTINWKRYKAHFGLENIFLRFPHRPAVSRSETLVTAFANDNTVLYVFSGHLPPVTEPAYSQWFDQVLHEVTQNGVATLKHHIFQETNFWILDYVALDGTQNLVIKGRAVVTPLNRYMLQCIKPNGKRDQFEHFVNNFLVECVCS